MTKSKLRLLNLGCGNSKLPLTLADEYGYTDIVNIDYSQPVVEKMREVDGLRLRKGKKNQPLKWIVGDVTDMQKTVDSNSVDVVIDKSTLDALYCGEGGRERVAKVLRECDRILLGKSSRSILLCFCGTEVSALLQEIGGKELGWEIKKIEGVTEKYGEYFAEQDEVRLPQIFVCKKLS